MRAAAVAVAVAVLLGAGLLLPVSETVPAQPGLAWEELLGERTRTSKKFVDATNESRFAVDASVGPLHFDGPNWLDINNTIVSSTANVPQLGLAQLEMVQDDYEWFALQTLNTIPLMLYRNRDIPESWISFNPQALQWTNDLDQLAQVSMPVTGIPGEVSENRLHWPDAYGPGRNLTIFASANRMIKHLTLDAYPGDPPQFVLDGGNPVLELVFNFRHPSGAQADRAPDIIVDGELWDKASRSQTVNEIIFQRTSSVIDPVLGEIFDNTTLFAFARPLYWDSSGPVINTGSMVLDRRGPNLRVGIRVPLAFLQSATYPVVIDPTVDLQPGVGSDDGWSAPTVGFFSISTSSTIAFSAGVAYDTFSRYPSVPVPQAATVDVAYLTATEESGIGPFNAETDIFMQDIDQAVAPVTQAGHAALTRTTAFTAWDNEAFVVDVPTNSPSIIPVVREILDRPGWRSGAAMMVLWDTGGVTAGHFYRPAALEAASNDPIILHIEYTIPPGVYEMRQGPFQGTVTERVTGSEFVADSSLIVSYDMETISGATLTDLSSAGNDGTLDGPTNGTGIFGSTLLFDGVDDLVDSGDIDALDGASAFTLSYWMLIDTLAIIDISVAKTSSLDGYNGFLVETGAGGVGGMDDMIIALGNGGQYGYSTADILAVDGWWNHLVVYDGSQADNPTRLRYFFGGAQQTLTFVGTIPATTPSTAHSFTVGATADSVRHINARIDDLVVLTRVATAAEIGFLSTHRNYTFRFNTTEPAGVSMGPTWYRGGGQTMGAAVNSSATGFGINITTWATDNIAWDSYATGTITTRYNFTLAVSTDYPYFVDGVQQGTFTTNANGNASFDWSSWTDHQFEIGTGEVVPPTEGGAGNPRIILVASGSYYRWSTVILNASAFVEKSEGPDPTEVLLYRWDMGDGTIRTGSEITHTYQVAWIWATYDVTLDVCLVGESVCETRFIQLVMVFWPAVIVLAIATGALLLLLRHKVRYWIVRQ